MPKPSELLRQSADPFDEACMLVRKIENVLESLVHLKDHKDKHGKDSYYLSNQPDVWERARKLLEKMK